MISKQEVTDLNNNADKYILLLRLLEVAYEKRKINKKEKKEMERRIRFFFSRNYWKLNPFIRDNQLLNKVSVSFLKRYYLA